jgi:Uma2 family endonuclease
MLEDDALLLLPTEEDLPDSDEQPVDNELQILAPALLRAILTYLWSDRSDWFFAINLGLYYDTNLPAIGPDAFLSLGVPRVRPSGKLRLSYIVAREQVMPQWVLEIVSRKPGGEYRQKFQTYAEIGVLYYTIYNPSHYRRDRHDAFEVYKLDYKLDNGRYVRQLGNPVWMPEIGLGIGHEVGVQEGVKQDWLYWYDAQGKRYPAQDEALKQARILREQEQIEREREQLRRRDLEDQLAQADQARLQAQQAPAQERRSLVLLLLTQKLGTLPEQWRDRMGPLSAEQLQDLAIACLRFDALADLAAWLEHQKSG